MKDEQKTKKQLINELVRLRQQIAELEESEAGSKLTECEVGESEEHYRVLVETIPHGVQEIDLSGTITFVNSAHCMMYGYGEEELIGKSALDLVASDSEREELSEYLASLVKEQPEPIPYVGQDRAKDGTIKDIQVDWDYKRDEDGRVIGFVSVLTDISQRKQVEEELRKAHDEMEQKVKERTSELLDANEQLKREIENRKRVEKRLRQSEAYMKGILNAAPVGIGLVHDRVFDWVSPRMIEMLGYSADELVGQSVKIVYESDEEFERVGRVKYPEIEELGVGAVETRFKRKDGSVIDVLLCSSAIDPEDLSRGVMLTALDVTELKQAERHMRESEQRYRSLFKDNHSVMLLIDPESADIVDANPAACSFYSWSWEEITSMKITDINMLSREQVFQEMERAKSEERKHFFFKHRLATEEIRDVEVYSGPIRLHGRELLYSIIHDITERKRVEDSLRESEAKYRRLVQNLPCCVYKGYKDWSVDFIDGKIEALTGISMEEFNSRRKKWSDMVAEEDMADVRKAFIMALKSDGAYVREYRIKAKGGEYCWIQERAMIVCDERGEIDYVSGVFFDTTEQKRAEEVLRKSETELQLKSSHLEEVNAALRVLLKRREEDKLEVEDSFLTNVKELIVPYVEKLKRSQLDPRQTTLVRILDLHLKEMVSPFITQLTSRFLNLTPTELRVASLIKDGRRNKDIAQVLSVSVNTIRSHRYNLRCKLGLKNKKVNLRSYLLSLQYE